MYDGDPELRKVLEKSDVSTFTVQEKYTIIEAYMQGGGAQGLQIELQEEGEEGDELDEETIEQMPEDNKRQLESQFASLFAQDESLRQQLNGAQPGDLSLFQKYNIMMQYGRAGGDQSLSEKRSDQDVIVIDGKQYTKVQIEDHSEEYLMDADNNIYDLNLKLVGVQGDSDDEDA